LRDRKSADICIIIPAYNEYKRIGSTIEKQAKELERWAAQILVCDDGSSDSTSAIAKTVANRTGTNLILLRQAHVGRGEALRHAVKKCVSRYVVFSSADVVVRNIEIEEALRRLRTAHLVMFSKVRSQEYGGTAFRRILSRCFALLVRTLFQVRFHDTQGVKVMRLLTAKQIMPFCRSKGFFLDAEVAIVALKHCLRVVEQPWRYSYSLGSKVTPSAIARMVIEMLVTRFLS